jgi:hypothetical protein
MLAFGGKNWAQIYPALYNNLGIDQALMSEKLGKNFVIISTQMVRFPGSGILCNLPDRTVILWGQSVLSKMHPEI